MIQYGIELEFASKHDRQYHVNNLKHLGVPIQVSDITIVPDFSKYWYLGTDRSVVDNLPSLKRIQTNGLELRSPIFQRFPSKVFSIILGYLKRNHCFTTNTSGLHIHFSGNEVYTNSSPVLRKHLSRSICKLRIPKKSRKAYCLSNSGKYVPINFIAEQHFECRVFNSSLKLRAVYHAWKQLEKIIKETVNQLGTNKVGESPTIVADCVVNHLICPPLNADDFVGIPQRM